MIYLQDFFAGIVLVSHVVHLGLEGEQLRPVVLSKLLLLSQLSLRIKIIAW